MKKNILFLTLFCVIIFSCQKEKVPSIVINQSEITISDAGGSQAISFEANMNWVAKSSDSWCTISPSSGDASTKSITISLASNDTYGARSGTITITVGNKSVPVTSSIKVHQSQLDAIMLKTRSFNLLDTAVILSVELNSNVKYDVSIPLAVQTWISQLATKSLTADNLQFKIERNLTQENRIAQIIVHQPLLKLADTLTIIQSKVPSSPTLTTTDAYDILNNSVKSGGNISNDGGAAILSKGVCWDILENPTIQNSKTNNGSGSGEFVSQIINLKANTKYYAKAYAINRSGTSYGNQISFTTDSKVPTLIEGSSNSIQHISATGDFTFRLNNLSNKEVFFVFSNIETKNSTALPQVNSIVPSVIKAEKFTTFSEVPFVVSGKPSISDFNNDPSKYPMIGMTKSNYEQYSISKPDKYIEGSSEFLNDEDGKPHSSTVRKVISAHGKNLHIWVDDECWGPSSTKIHHITQQIVDVFAPKFLNIGADNDIYEWVSNICGEPWGPTGYSNLITNADDIHIWLTDINNDNKNTGTVTVGYFYARDNYLKTSSANSNEKLLFTIDAVLLASTTNGTWDVGHYWPMKVISTLAHEFTHMVYFYQKQVLQKQAGNTAVNEMCAQCVEDLVANKILSDGPRGVSYTAANSGSSSNKKGRLPLYNFSNDYNLLDWSKNSTEVLLNYSKTYALGAYLMRNYGGANFINELIQNNSTGINSIVDAVNSNGGGNLNYDHILQRFGAANLMSNITEVPEGYRLNTGSWFTSSRNGITYELGSINLYNYSPIPYIYSEVPLIQQPGSNTFYRAGNNLNGTKEWSFVGLTANTKFTVVIK